MQTSVQTLASNYVISIAHISMESHQASVDSCYSQKTCL